MPERSDCMTTAPRTAPGIVPMPPANEVPPMTAAAMTSSSCLRRRGRVDRGVEAGRLDRGADGAQHAHQDERLHDRPAGVDAAELGRLGVAADGVDVAAEAAPRGDEGHHQGDADERSGPGRRCRVGIFRPPSGRDAVSAAYCSARPLGPGVAVGDPDGRERRPRSRRRRATTSAHIGRSGKPYRRAPAPAAISAVARCPTQPSSPTTQLDGLTERARRRRRRAAGRWCPVGAIVWPAASWTRRGRARRGGRRA